MVLKRLDSPYAPGKRTGAWLKVKNTLRQELVIGGWTPGEGRRKDHLGALLVGYFEGEGDARALRYGGKVGTGFKQVDLEELAERLAPLARKTSPFERARRAEKRSLRRAAAGRRVRVPRDDQGGDPPPRRLQGAA